MNCNLCEDTGYGYAPGTFCHCAAGQAKLATADMYRRAVDRFYAPPQRAKGSKNER